jgi:hypothetical protein
MPLYRQRTLYRAAIGTSGPASLGPGRANPGGGSGVAHAVAVAGHRPATIPVVSWAGAVVSWAGRVLPCAGQVLVMTGCDVGGRAAT